MSAGGFFFYYYIYVLSNNLMKNVCLTEQIKITQKKIDEILDVL
jgi:hypothetical protein